MCSSGFSNTPECSGRGTESYQAKEGRSSLSQKIEVYCCVHCLAGRNSPADGLSGETYPFSGSLMLVCKKRPGLCSLPQAMYSCHILHVHWAFSFSQAPWVTVRSTAPLLLWPTPGLEYFTRHPSLGGLCLSPTWGAAALDPAVGAASPRDSCQEPAGCITQWLSWILGWVASSWSFLSVKKVAFLNTLYCVFIYPPLCLSKHKCLPCYQWCCQCILPTGISATPCYATPTVAWHPPSFTMLSRGCCWGWWTVPSMQAWSKVPSSSSVVTQWCQ